MKTIERIFNAATGETIDVERDMTPLEIDEYENGVKALAELEIEEKAKIAAKAALLEKLGITEDEAKLLLS